MSKTQTTFYIGLGKTKFNSSVCWVNEDGSEVEMWVTERLNRKKASGDWPFEALELLKKKLLSFPDARLVIAENRDVVTPAVVENFLNDRFPFYEYLKKHQLDIFSTHFNADIEVVNHHEAHAYAALAISPFTQSMIVVVDGAGSEIGEGSGDYEDCSVYLQEGAKLTLVLKKVININKSSNPALGVVSSGMGLCYEKISEYIFNSSTNSGKVMGLAPFAKALPIHDRKAFLDNLDWTKAFKGKSKKEWESSAHQDLYRHLAACVQADLEQYYLELLVQLKAQFPDYKNIILTGGCALNCTNNAKILKQHWYDDVFVVPFPGDESIGFGLAHRGRIKHNPTSWKPVSLDHQHAYWGSRSTLLSDDEIEVVLKARNFSYSKCADVIEVASRALLSQQIIGWWQGRSECGPRALGNRSILAFPERAGLKNYLNHSIKGRETFRPYGCSVLQNKAHLYFEVNEEFDNPFMSFAVKVRAEFKHQLAEVSHVDQTSRMQTVRENQNKLFYELIKKVGDQSGLYCLLNTSLNVMGEPIVETLEEALHFFEHTAVDTMFVGPFQLLRKVPA